MSSAPNTIVSFGSAGVTLNETDSDFTYNVPVTVTNPNANPVNVTITRNAGSGQAADINGFVTISFTVPANTGSMDVTLTITGDAAQEPTETFVFEITSVSGGNAAAIGTPNTFTLTLTDDDAPLATFVRINEVDPSTPGTDEDEFIELFDGGAGNSVLNGLVLVHVNGSNDQVIFAIDLDGYTTNAQGLFVAGNSGVSPAPAVTFANNTLQNGVDAVALYVGNATDFPNGTVVTTVTGPTLLDAVVYGNARDEGFLDVFTAPVQYNEGYNANGDNESLQRLNVPGVGYTDLLYNIAPTPGALNPATVAVDQTTDVFNPSTAGGDGAGWRHLSSPVFVPDGGGSFRSPFVGDYAPVNLVQGVPAGTVFPAQHPTAGDNMLTRYLNGNYANPANTDEILPPGLGFMWYFYDLDITPGSEGGGGTSVSYELDNPAFALSLTGLPLDDLVETATGYAMTTPLSTDGFYNVGNPYAYPYYLGNAGVSSGTLSTNFYVWDPGASTSGSFSVLTGDTAEPTAGDALPVFNGAFAEVTGATGPAVTFTTSSDFVDPTEAAAFIGRPASAEGRLTLRLDGTIGTTTVADYAAVLRIRPDALVGWDQHDGSKLIPPAATFALLAPMGERDGAPYRQGVRSLPYELGWPFVVPVSFRATGAGAFTITPDGVASLPADWHVSLTDHVAGTTVDLRAGAYTFAAEAGDWTERFTLTMSAVTTGAGTEAPAFALSAAVPNPSTARAALTLTTAVTEHVTAVVYDALGRRVATIYDGQVSAGASTALVVETGALAPGAYVVRVAGETFTESRRLTVVR